MKYLLILTLVLFPPLTLASPKDKVEIKQIDKKKLSYKQQRELKKSVDNKTCHKAVDKKTKKEYYVCK